MSKNKDYIRLIHDTRWVALRAWKLQNNPTCEECSRNGQETIATEVHHIKPVESGITHKQMEMLCYSKNNLMALCHKCHAAIHKAMGRNTKVENIDRERQRKDDFKRKFLDY